MRLLLCLVLWVVPLTAVRGQDGRVSIPGRDFEPTLNLGPQGTRVHVDAFLMDPRPVTNAQFLKFVIEHPVWRRGTVPALFADSDYLAHWEAPTQLGSGAGPQQPVTRVSWFAARAYCAAVGGRLPRWSEWELTAAADEHSTDARSDTLWRSQILDWYSKPASEPLREVGLMTPNAYGVQDLNGLIWEWVEDFGSLLVSGDSRTQGDPDKLAFCAAGALSARDRDNYPVLMRIAFLSSLEGRSTARSLGFRCAVDGNS